MKARAVIAFIALLCGLQNFLYAQLSFKCAGKNYFIPEFRRDSVPADYPQIQFEKLKILPAIQNSGYEIEIRAYYQVLRIFGGSAIIIKGNSDSLTVDAYYYQLQQDAGDTIAQKGDKIVRWAKRNVYYSVKSFIPPDSLIDALIKNGLFCEPNVEEIIDSLKSKNIHVLPTRAMDPYSMKFEIKIKDSYRSFYCDPFTSWSNENIKDLLPEKKLFDLFNALYIKSGQNLNHLFP